MVMLTRMNFEFFVALRYLKAKRRQAAISIITVIIEMAACRRLALR